MSLKEKRADVIYRIVGIDGSKTPDPRYWQDRWTAELTDTNDEAIRKHKIRNRNFYNSFELHHIAVIGTIIGVPIVNSDCYVWEYIAKYCKN